MKENKKKVSIVLPVYNGETVLGEAIESVLAQTYTNIELLIVNDCSTDDSEKIIDFYVNKDSRVKKINNIQNLKLPASLNVGFQKATGDYWTWTSDDNMYKENAIECMVNCLENDKNICLVYTDYTVIDISGKKLYKQITGKPKELAQGNCIGACFLYRRESAINVGNYDINLFLAEDYDYWIRLYKQGDLYHLNMDLYYYRQHENSLSATQKERIEIQTFRVWEKNFIFLFSLLDKTSQKILFMDRMVYMSSALGEEMKVSTTRMLCNVWPRYKAHVRYLFVRHKVGETVIGRVYRNRKG